MYLDYRSRCLLCLVSASWPRWSRLSPSLFFRFVHLAKCKHVIGHGGSGLENLGARNKGKILSYLGKTKRVITPDALCCPCTMLIVRTPTIYFYKPIRWDINKRGIQYTDLPGTLSIHILEVIYFVLMCSESSMELA